MDKKRNIFTPQDNFSRFKSQTTKNNQKPNNNNNTNQINPNQTTKNFYKTLNNFIDQSGGGKIISKYANKFGYEEENKDIIESNPLLYNLGYEQLKKENAKKEQLKNKEKNDQNEKLEYLKEIAFVNIMNKDRAIKKMKINKNKDRDFDNSDFLEDFNEMENEGKANRTIGQSHNTPNFLKIIKKKNKVDEDNIVIGDVPFSRTQTDLIAKQILKNCNYNTDKNKNNNTRLLSGNGKLSITSGMTLNDFNKKYNFD